MQSITNILFLIFLMCSCDCRPNSHKIIDEFLIAFNNGDERGVESMLSIDFKYKIRRFGWESENDPPTFDKQGFLELYKKYMKFFKSKRYIISIDVEGTRIYTVEKTITDIDICLGTQSSARVEYEINEGKISMLKESVLVEDFPHNMDEFKFWERAEAVNPKLTLKIRNAIRDKREYIEELRLLKREVDEQKDKKITID